MKPSAELEQVHLQALDIAAQAGQPLSTAHVLLAVFTVPNLAELLLLDRAVDERALLAQIEVMEPEPEDALAEVEARAEQLARGCDDDQINCLHLLAAMTRMPRSFAYRLLQRTGIPIPTLRNTAIRYAAHGVPQRLLKMARVLEAETLDEEAVQEEAAQEEAAQEEAAIDRGDIEVEVDEPNVKSDTLVEATALPPRRVVEPRAEPSSEAERRTGTPGRRAGDRGHTARKPAAPLPGQSASRRPAGRHSAAAVRAAPSSGSSAEPPSPYLLNRDRFRWLRQLGRNLSHEAWLDKLDPVLGRDREIVEAIDVLNKRRSNNPCLVGEPGVGKTAVAEGIARRLVEETSVRGGSPDRVVIQIDVGAILAGTHLRGSLAERLRGLQEEVRRAEGAIIIFIDEIHTLIGAGGGDGPHDAANELKAALARGELPCIGATTIDEYRRHVESDPALERRFTPVYVDEPDEATTLQILEGVTGRYAEHHGVEYLPAALDAAVRMGRRYIYDRRDPDKSLGVLDLAGAVARRAGNRVGRREVAEVVSRMARVPVGHLLVDDPQRFLNMERHLAEHIVGQRHALTAVSETIRRNFAGFAGRRPIGSFLFLGPTGVGKTEVVKVLASFLFGHRDALVRFDMSEYSESHSMARMIGSPPGYVGHAEGGQLTESVRRRPYQVVLFDEVEKAHREIWNLFLQILDEGRLTDGHGRCVDFTNAVVVMTSNLGADVFDSPAGRRIGFAGGGGGVEDQEDRESQVLQRARTAFAPELYNRIECRLVFHPLDKEQIRAVARLILDERSKLLHAERQIDFETDPAVIDVLIERGGFDPRLGARPMRQTIAREVEARLAEHILAGELKAGDHVRIACHDGELVFEPINDELTR